MKIRIIKEQTLDINMRPVQKAIGAGLSDEQVAQQNEKAVQALYNLMVAAKNDPAKTVQLIAELAGLVPVVGNIGDILAMFIALYRKKPVEALFNFLAALPAIGLGARVLQKSFVAAGGAKAFMKFDRGASIRAMAEAWKMAGPAFQRTFGSKWVYKISGSKVKVLEDIEAARRELNKILKDNRTGMFATVGQRTRLSGIVNDHFGKIDFLLQVTFAGLGLAYGDKLKQATGEDIIPLTQGDMFDMSQIGDPSPTAAGKSAPKLAPKFSRPLGPNFDPN